MADTISAGVFITMTLSNEELALLKTELTESIKQELMSNVNASLNGLSAKLSKKIEEVQSFVDTQPQKSEQLEQNTDPSVLALKTELEKLKSELTAKDKQAQQLEKRNILSSYLSKTVNPNSAVKLLELEMGEKLVKSESGQWYVQDNDSVTPVDKFVEDYLNNDGKWLVKGTDAAPTGGESGKPVKTSGAKEITLADLVTQRYSQ